MIIKGKGTKINKKKNTYIKQEINSMENSRDVVGSTSLQFLLMGLLYHYL